MIIEKSILEKILNTKTEVQFMRTVFEEKIPFNVWHSNREIKEHFEKIRYKIDYPAEHNIGYLRKKNK